MPYVSGTTFGGERDILKPNIQGTVVIKRFEEEEECIKAQARTRITPRRNHPI